MAEVIWLQRQELYDSVATFDPDARAFKEYSRRLLGDAQPRLVGDGCVVGWYSKLQRCGLGRILCRPLLVAIYGLGGRLFLLVDDKLLEIHPGEIIEVSGPRQARRLVVSQYGEPVFTVDYSLAGIPGPIPGDDTPFVEEEDFDIGLLASNVSKNDERRSLFTDR